jgi:DNA-binding winged helix-turn-helix (wHTH) protein
MSAGAGRTRQETISFGEFELDPAGQTLSAAGVPVKLQRQPFHVLQLLAERAPEVVSREEIRRHVWGEAVYVDATQSINFCIRQIRLALGDTSAGSRFIETLPRQGYRFIAPVQGVRAHALRPELASAKPSRPSLLEKSWLITGVAGLIVAGALVAIWAWFHGRYPDLKVVRLSRITTYSGAEREPSLSPDGRQVAFSWGTETGENRDIYVKHIGEHRPLRLTSDPAEDGQPAWSPDGKQIAFIRRRTGTRADIMLIPAIGGTERNL